LLYAIAKALSGQKSQPNMKSTFKIILIITFLISNSQFVISQVAINSDGTDPDASTILDVSSSSQGVLVPSMTSDERDAIANPAAGLMIFNTTDSCFNYYTGVAWYKDCGRDMTTDSTTYEGMAVSASSTGRGEIQSIAIDSEDNILISGRFNNSITIGDTTLTSSGDYDVYFAKLDSDENLQWIVQITSSSSISYPYIDVDASDNIYMAAQIGNAADINGTSLTTSDEALVLAKYNSSGTQQWATATDLGSTNELNGMDVDDNGNIYVVGSFRGTITVASTSLNASTREGFLLKADNSGNWQWAEQSNSTSSSYFYGLAVKGDSIYVVGMIEGTVTLGDSTFTTAEEYGFVAKYDANKTFVCAQQYISDDDMAALSVAVDDNYNFFVGGYVYDETTIGDTTFTSNGEGYFVVKYNKSNQYQWINYGEGDYMPANALTVDPSGNILSTGFFDGTKILGSYTITSNGRDDIYLIQYDTNGNINWIVSGGSDEDDDGLDVAVNSSNIAYVVGSYTNTATFSGTTYTANGTDEGLLVAFSNLNGEQTVLDNSLTNTKDADLDNTDEIQDISLSGTTLTISNGNSIDLSTADIDNQTVDIFSLSGNTLSLSLEDDGESDKTVDLSTIITNTGLTDNDGNTQIQVEETSNEDVIRFDMNGVEFMTMDSARLEVFNAGNSIFIGNGTGQSDDYNDNRNVFIGDEVGMFNTSGRRNVYLGYQAGYSSTTATKNVILGYQAGYSNRSGVRNVFIGNEAGYYETGDNKLYIENSNATNPLIYGDFDLDSVQFNGTFTVVDNNNGDEIYATYFKNGANNTSELCNGIQIIAGHDTYNNKSNRFIDFATPDGTSIGKIRQNSGGIDYSTISDIRLKANIQPTKYGIEDILNIHVRDYYYKGDSTFTAQTGFIAQQLHSIIPSVVTIGGENANRNPWKVDYSKLTPIIVKGIQDQQQEIDLLKKDNDQQKAAISNIQAQVNEIEQQVDKIDKLEAMLLEMKGK
jgi:hypothetical protein